jgi:hypothetical protein
MRERISPPGALLRVDGGGPERASINGWYETPRNESCGEGDCQ